MVSSTIPNNKQCVQSVKYVLPLDAMVGKQTLEVRVP